MCWDKYIRLRIAQRIWMVRFMLYLSWQDLDLFVFISLFLRNSVFLFISKKDSKSYSNSLKKTMICPYGIRKTIFIYVIAFFKKMIFISLDIPHNAKYILISWFNSVAEKSILQLMVFLIKLIQWNYWIENSYLDVMPKMRCHANTVTRCYYRCYHVKCCEVSLFAIFVLMCCHLLFLAIYFLWWLQITETVTYRRVANLSTFALSLK